MVAMATQWRYAGMTALAAGLDYAAMPAVLRLVGVPRSEWGQVFEDLRVMEDAAMAVMNRKRGGTYG